MSPFQNFKLSHHCHRWFWEDRSQDGSLIVISHHSVGRLVVLHPLVVQKYESLHGHCSTQKVFLSPVILCFRSTVLCGDRVLTSRRFFTCVIAAFRSTVLCTNTALTSMSFLIYAWFQENGSVRRHCFDLKTFSHSCHLLVSRVGFSARTPFNLDEFSSFVSLLV